MARTWKRRMTCGVLLFAVSISAGVPLVTALGATSDDWLGHSLDVYAALHPGVQVLLALAALVVGGVAVWSRARESRSTALLSQIARQMQDGMSALQDDSTATRAEVAAISARLDGIDQRLWDHVTEEEGSP